MESSSDFAQTNGGVDGGDAAHLRTKEAPGKSSAAASSSASTSTSPAKTTATSTETEDANLQMMTDAVRTLIVAVGEDPTREGLLKTPLRMAKALQFFTKGYHESMEEIVGGAVFEENHEDMVIVRDIDLFSLCEHHMIPFYGKVTTTNLV